MPTYYHHKRSMSRKFVSENPKFLYEGDIGDSIAEVFEVFPKWQTTGAPDEFVSTEKPINPGLNAGGPARWSGLENLSVAVVKKAPAPA